MQVFIISADVAVDHGINLKVDWIEKIHDKNHQGEQCTVLIVEFRTDPSGMPERSQIDIGEQKPADNRSDEKENEIGTVFKQKGTPEKHPVKNPGQGLHDDGNRSRDDDDLKELAAEGHHFRMPDKEIETEKNKKRKNIDLKLYKIIHDSTPVVKPIRMQIPQCHKESALHNLTHKFVLM